MPQPRTSKKPKSPFEGERELILVADPGAGLHSTPDGLAAAEVDAAPITKAVSGAKADVTCLFGATEERIRHQAARVAAVTGVEAPDLAVYYRVVADDQRLDALAETLAGQEGVAGAYVKPPAEPPVALDDLNIMTPAAADAPPATPDFTAQQGYLDAAPGGIDARHAWTMPGGRGAGVNIIDIEGAWRFDHEDLVTNQGGVVGTQSTDIGWRNHGTAVVGEFGGDVNSFGITGIASDANARGFSIFAGSGSAAAIRNAADALQPGDVLLIELHRPGPGASGAGQDGFIAIEWWEDDWQALRYATTTRGVVVVEAAGNGARNLDDPIYNTPQQGFPPGWTNPFNRSNRDSGAIIVGAGAPPSGNFGPDRSRLDFSNWGACVDAQGWGREVVTAAYGDLQGGTDEKLWYTRSFSGTSSASPIVVGAVACVQGNRRANGQAPLTPAQMRNQLRTTGSPQQDGPGRPASQRIGNRPNLRQLLPGMKKIEKLEKPEIKEKREKIEKPEIKEKREIKEKPEKREKREKVEKIEKSEKPEKLEKREKVENKEKLEKPEKREKLEFEKDEIREKEFREEVFKDVGGEVKTGVREGLEIDQLRDRLRERFIRPSGAGGGVEDRLAAIESELAALSHFIGSELRPDLSQGALANEQDFAGGGKEPEKLSEGW
jgi:subtilisin family serine protease